ncbi:MAG: zinc ribbon domain-containing protein, partial [Phycisphaerae bacterium]|nr:zinc ribbon domain-containing protein [Phycisphaerae bacterium]
ALSRGLGDVYKRQTGNCLRVFMGHRQSVTSVAISPDGRRGLSGSEDKTLRVWNLATGKCLRKLEGHKDKVICVAISPDGQRALSGGGLDDLTVRLWELATGNCLRVFTGHRQGVTSVAISPDGRLGLSGSKDNTLRLWELATGKCLRTFGGRGGGKDVTSIAISPDGRWTLTGHLDQPLRLWELNTGKSLRTFEGHTATVHSVAVSPDGRWALSGSYDRTVRLWKLATGECLSVFEGHTSSVNSVALSLDGRWALSGSADRKLGLWQLDWEYEFPGWADWDEAARPYLKTFLTLHCALDADSISRKGKPSWTDEDFHKLTKELQTRGFGWLRAEGVRRELEKMTQERRGSALPGESPATAPAVEPPRPAPPRFQEMIRITRDMPPAPAAAETFLRQPFSQKSPGPEGPTVLKPASARTQPSEPAERPCQHCGNLVAADLRFCTHCGTPADKAGMAQRAAQGESESIACRCGSRNPPGNSFCSQCGQPLQARPLLCPRCRATLPGEVRFCVQCGAPLESKEGG